MSSVTTKDTENDFVAYLVSHGMGMNVARSTSAALGFTESRQLRFVTEEVIQDIRELFFDDLVLSDYHLDELNKICQVYRDEHKKDRRT